MEDRLGQLLQARESVWSSRKLVLTHEVDHDDFKRDLDSKEAESYFVVAVDEWAVLPVGLIR